MSKHRNAVGKSAGFPFKKFFILMALLGGIIAVGVLAGGGIYAEPTEPASITVDGEILPPGEADGGQTSQKETSPEEARAQALAEAVKPFQDWENGTAAKVNNGKIISFTYTYGTEDARSLKEVNTWWLGQSLASQEVVAQPCTTYNGYYSCEALNAAKESQLRALITVDPGTATVESLVALP